MAEILGKDDIVIGLVGDPRRDKFHIIHVSRWALVPRAVIPEPFLSHKFTSRNINSDLGLRGSHQGSPVFGAEWQVGQRRRQPGRRAGAHRVGTVWEILVCSVSLEDEGVEGQRDRLEIELPAWPGCLGHFQQHEP